MASEAEYQLAMLGEGGVGKSSLVIRFVMNAFYTEYDTTIEDTYRHRVDVEGTPSTLEILDTAGGEEFNALIDNYIRNKEAFLVVYSITSRESFEAVDKIVERILRIKDENEYSLIVLVGNKLDLSQRQVSIEEGEGKAKRFGAAFFETSAKEGTNVVDSFLEAARRVKQYNSTRVAHAPCRRK